MTGTDIILLLILAVVMYFVVRSLIKQRKQGGCAYCSEKGKCPSGQKVELKPSMKKQEDPCTCGKKHS